MTTHEPFYVYIIRDPRPGKNHAPIYVGKGKGNRANDHLTHTTNFVLARIIAKCAKAGLNVIIRKVKHFEVEVDAYAYEIKLIARYGRRDLGTGTLCNMTDGGEGMTSEDAKRLAVDPAWKERNRELLEWINSDPEIVAKRSASRRNTFERGGECSANMAKGVARSWANQEIRTKRIAALIQTLATPEARAKKMAVWANQEIRAKISAAQRGKKRSPETCAKMSAAQRSKKLSPETRAKISAAHTGQKLSKEHRAKVSAALLGRKHSLETRAKMSATRLALVAAMKMAKEATLAPFVIAAE